MADIKISQIGAFNAGARASTDLFETENAAGTSGRYSRQNGITLLESDLLTLDNSNYLLNSTPLEVVAAPGNALQVLVPTHLALFLDYGGTAFDFGAAGIDLVWTTATGTAIINIPQSLINATSDQRRLISLEVPLGTAFAFNDSLSLFAAADPTQGNSSVYIRVLYSLQDFNT